MKLIKNATIVNESRIFPGSVLIIKDKIEDIFEKDIPSSVLENADLIDAYGLHLFPGVIDDQVHFREPGLTHKGDIYSESKAAVAGGITSYMEMPNTKPQTTTQAELANKFKIAAANSLTNYSFYIGATNDNLDELLATDVKHVCGIKIFMGSSTGNMLVDNVQTLEHIFSKSKMLIATHCEDESTIQENIAKYKEQFGENVPMQFHPIIRSEEACYKSTSFAVELARKHDTRLHILHLSTARELNLFSNKIPSSQKRITAEVCVHHLWFDDSDYAKLGSRIKWNPAIKTKKDRDELLKAVIDNRIDVIATDHAPHTVEEKDASYFKSMSGGPLAQHSLPVMLELYHQKKISLEKIAEKMSHAPAEIFNIKQRGFIRKGYNADLVLVNLQKKWTVEKSNILYKCRWSPFEGTTFHSQITHTFVNGNLVFDNGSFFEQHKGNSLVFSR